jgi:hypothetical protein
MVRGKDRRKTRDTAMPERLPGDGSAENPDPAKEERQRRQRYDQQRRRNFDIQKRASLRRTQIPQLWFESEATAGEKAEHTLMV